MMRQYRHHEQGATSLLVVMFSVLLFVVVTVGFMQMMAAEQSSSNDNELSRGAYDSALAGVEDGKRVLKACLDAPNTSGAASCAAITADACNTTAASNIVSETNGEVYLQTSSSSTYSKQYDQAYTCVKIALDTKDYLGKLEVGDSSSKIIPLRTVESAGRLTVRWFTSFGGTLEDYAPASLPLLSKDDWGLLRPSVLRLQLINLPVNDSDEASITALDGATEASGMRTVYLYPQQQVTNNFALQPLSSFAADTRTREAGPSLMNAVWCNTDRTVNITGYVCQAIITLPEGLDTTQDGVYIRIAAAYNATEFSISPELEQPDGTWVSTKYEGVQPAIDSTGRAADVFRRVEARVESSDSEVAYPRATVDITNNLCKTLTVTDVYYDGGSCSP